MQFQVSAEMLEAIIVMEDAHPLVGFIDFHFALGLNY